MATNNADWIQPQRHFIPLRRRVNAQITICDVLISSTTQPFDWQIHNHLPYFTKSYFFLKPSFHFPDYDFIPVPLPTAFTWLRETNLPPSLLRARTLHSSSHPAYMSGNTEVNNTSYYRRYLNDIGTVNPSINSR